MLEETLGSGAVPPVLHQNVEHNAVLIHCAPQIVQHAPDADEHLIEVPGVSWPRTSSAQPSGEVGSVQRMGGDETGVRSVGSLTGWGIADAMGVAVGCDRG